ncbi:hypothetical protein ODJ79_04615 [Actinoplanes sp. KI2]|uniref:hypothetical protein n=1 Tax=Actinoplanes sp. KI2 TaxID=2983315 RepID=UPI0021D57A91|nr:hypothetical protein [Actinoplanes sp. KI2]MCU7722989.1 hypothetical protein [Actinoplanes sp. KI2]
MTSSPSDPWGGSAPRPDDPWSVPPATPPGGYSPTTPPGGNPPVQAAPDPGPVIVQIAEISVTSTTVLTPTGNLPLAGSHWQVNDYWFSQQRIPRWAIIVAIAGFCVLTVFSLLFLLVKETVMQGTVQVTVTNGSLQYVARIPVTDQATVTSINQQVNYVRTLAAL